MPLAGVQCDAHCRGRERPRMPKRTLTGLLILSIAGAATTTPAAAEPLRWSWPAAGPAIGMATTTSATSAQSPSARRRDPLWNGILIGAALGVLAIYTTAAEAPPSGKATTVVLLAATGAFVDSRLSVTHALPSPQASG